jgi:dimethylargininase
MPLAITRQVSPRFAECELTHIERTPIDVDVARSQHHNYVEALRGLGYHVVELPAEADLPDSVFVEDAAFILPEAAVITRPGADSRKSETASIAEVLSPHRELVFVRDPATVDGGDVLVLDKDIYIGLSTRSGQAAIDQLQNLLARFGYRVQGVELHDCLHLKTAVTRLGQNSLLINRNWVDTRPFEKYEFVDVAESEPMAANILMLGEMGLYPTAFPETQSKLESRGVKLVTVDVSELAKAEGAITCCSLILS